MRGSIGQPLRSFAAPDADISSDETHPQVPSKAPVPDVPAFEASAKSGGSELFDALLMAATGVYCMLSFFFTLLPCNCTPVQLTHLTSWHVGQQASKLAEVQALSFRRCRQTGQLLSRI